MALPQSFQFLDISGLCPATDEELARVSDLDTHGVLQICVRNLRLFRDCDAPSIRDIRVPPSEQNQRDFPCQDRESLVWHLALRLDIYESMLVALMTEARTKYDLRLAVLDEIARDAPTYVRWFKRGARWREHIPADDRINASKLLEALGELRLFARAWFANVLTLPTAKPYVRQRLIESLYAAFVAHGPQLGRTLRRYSDQALYAAIYSILEAFGIESGTDMTNGSRRIAYVLKKIPPA